MTGVEPVHGGLAKWQVDGRGTVSERSLYERQLGTGAPPSVIAAADILEDDGISYEKACEIAVAAHRSGRDPEEVARHMVKLRAAIR